MTPEQILSIVAGYFKVTPEDIKSINRCTNIRVARNIAIYFTTRVTTFSLNQIGAIYNRDHTTIINSRNRVIDAIETNDFLYIGHVGMLKQKITEPVADVEFDELDTLKDSQINKNMRVLRRKVITLQNQVLDMEQDNKILQGRIRYLEGQLNKSNVVKMPFVRAKPDHTNTSPMGIALAGK